MSMTAVNGTITFQSNGDSPVILREVAEMVEGFQRLQLPVAVTITVMLDGEMAMPAVKEAPAATANFSAPVPDADGVKEGSRGNPPYVLPEAAVRALKVDWVDDMDGVDWGVTGLTSLANQARLSLNGGETTWRKVPKAIRLELVQAVLAQPTESGEPMTMGEFDRVRPAWMPQPASLPTTFGCSWSELHGLRLSE